MILGLTSTVKALRNGLTSSFLGTGGTPPYAYAVLDGGVGGTIDNLTGDYVAPAVGLGADTIQVTDSLNASAVLKVLVCTPLQLFCDILQHEMDLEEGRVYLWDQKINQPKDAGLYIAVGVLNAKPFGSSVAVSGAGPGLEAEQGLNMAATISIDVISRGPEARDRKEEVILALQSIYAQSQQEINSFYIGKLSTAFTNLSQEDGAAIPYRFNITVVMQYVFRKLRAVDYFDAFAPVDIVTEP